MNARRSADLIGYLASSSQIFVIANNVIELLLGHRQTKFWQREAGGQLFGTASPQAVHITSATVPHKRDERSRFSFRSSPHIAQQRIEDKHQVGLTYLGEWHTHAERIPIPSMDDLQAMSALIAASTLSTSALLLMIVGTAPVPQGISFILMSHQGHQVITLG